MRECICKSCNKKYSVENWRKPSSFCSNNCRNNKASTWLLKTSFIIESASEKEKIERLALNFNKFVIIKNGCWDWKGKLEKGYPKMTCRKSLGANLGHRASWIINNGPIPEGMCILHRCDNRKCTNIDHLFLGTNEDNVNDMLSKKRNPKGSQVGTSKLKEKEVIEIKKLLTLGVKISEISSKFNVTYQAISLIKKNVNWKHIPFQSE